MVESIAVFDKLHFTVHKGTVFLIGAGPGDPSLLTLKGRRLLASAQAVVYDALIAPQLLQWAAPNAERIFVGKRRGSAAAKQSDINALLARLASRGLQVARLKGGDPFLFGRGGEEAAYLASRRIPFEIVPGVTSASGVAAYAGIPLTDRRLSSMVTFVTGHEGKEKSIPPVDWQHISPRSTLVVFMGLNELTQITKRLATLGWSHKTPAAAIHWGSTSRQKVVEATVGTLLAKTKAAALASPVLVIIGKVVSLRKKIRWFDSRPLFGRKIIVTRAADQAQEFIRLLEEAGAEVISVPTIQIVPPRQWGALDQAIRNISSFDWILFTSVNGVAMFFARLKTLGRDIRDLKGLQIGAIGPKTSARLQEWGLHVDVFPDEYRAEALADALGRVKGSRVLLARAEKARDILPKTLTARGALVTVANVYRTLKPQSFSLALREHFHSADIDAVTFTSSSTVDGFMQHLAPRQRRAFFKKARAAVIGPITADTLRSYGVRPAIQAKTYTIEALAKAIVKYFS